MVHCLFNTKSLITWTNADLFQSNMNKNIFSEKCFRKCYQQNVGFLFRPHCVLWRHNAAEYHNVWSSSQVGVGVEVVLAIENEYITGSFNYCVSKDVRTYNWRLVLITLPTFPLLCVCETRLEIWYNEVNTHSFDWELSCNLWLWLIPSVWKKLIKKVNQLLHSKLYRDDMMLLLRSSYSHY